mmetsp:Transcript_29959/g.99239  ORF Transcript_29959/g.99239 Transcript_29959/m.99239 type:complete len:221 (-) Transcript_29959:2132-2794(-)
MAVPRCCVPAARPAPGRRPPSGSLGAVPRAWGRTCRTDGGTTWRRATTGTVSGTCSPTATTWAIGRTTTATAAMMPPPPSPPPVRARVPGSPATRCGNCWARPRSCRCSAPSWESPSCRACPAACSQRRPPALDWCAMPSRRPLGCSAIRVGTTSWSSEASTTRCASARTSPTRRKTMPWSMPGPPSSTSPWCTSARVQSSARPTRTCRTWSRVSGACSA